MIYSCTSFSYIDTKLFYSLKAKESWSLDSNEKIEQAKLFKEKGTAYFKAGKLNLAVKMYKKILSYLENETGKKNIINSGDWGKES